MKLGGGTCPKIFGGPIKTSKYQRNLWERRDLIVNISRREQDIAIGKRRWKLQSAITTLHVHLSWWTLSHKRRIY